MNQKTIGRGLILAGGVFLGNLVGVPLIQKGKTLGDGFMVGCIAFFLVMVVYGIIAGVQGRNGASDRPEKTTPVER